MAELDRGGAGGIPYGPAYFSKPPFRSYFFVTNTLLFAMALSVLVFDLVSGWSVFAASTILWLCIIGGCMVAFWVLALRSYASVRCSLKARVGMRVDDSSVESAALSSAAAMLHWGMFFAYFMTMGALMQLGNALRHH